MFTSSDGNLPDSLFFSPGNITKNQKRRAKKQRGHEHNGPINPYYRMREPKRVAAVLVEINKENEPNNNARLVFTQFKTKCTLNNSDLYRSLIIEEPTLQIPTIPTKTQYENYQFSAHTPNGSKMNSKRSVNIDDNGSKKRLLFFSPVKNKAETIAVSLDTVNRKRKFENDLVLDFENIEIGGVELEAGEVRGQGEAFIIPSSKQLNRKKLKSNKSVMGGKSAEQEILNFLEKNQDKYDADHLSLLKVLAHSFKMEWLHRLGIGLSPKNFNPQTKENLGAGPKVINTLMMVLEHVATYFSFNHLGEVSVKPEFIMLPESQIIEKINYSVTIKKDECECVISQSTPALALPSRSNWPSTTDETLVREIVNELLNKREPAKVDSFTVPTTSDFAQKKLFMC